MSWGNEEKDGFWTKVFVWVFSLAVGGVCGGGVAVYLLVDNV